MMTRNKIKNSIAHLAVKQGARPPYQGGVEKLVPVNSFNHNNEEIGNHKEETQHGLIPQPSKHVANPTNMVRKKMRKPWTMEECKELIWCYEYICEKTGTANQKLIYETWRERNHVRPEMDANKLAGQRRYIMKSQKLTEDVMEGIKRNVRLHCQSQGLEIRKESGEADEGECQNFLLEERDVRMGQMRDVEVKSKKDELKKDLKELSEKHELEDQKDKDVVMDTTNQNEDHKEVQNEYKKLEEQIIDRFDLFIKNLVPHERLPKVSMNGGVRQKLRDANKIVDDILSKMAPEEITITVLNHMVYTVAEVVTRTCERRDEHQRKEGKPRGEDPPWKRRIQKQIECWRRDLSRLKEIRVNGQSSVLVRYKQILYRRYQILQDTDIDVIEENLMQKISAKAQRIRRYERRKKQYIQNKQFMEDRKKFYRNLGKKEIIVKNIPTQEQIELYWGNMWEDGKVHNTNASWIEQFENKNKPEGMVWTDITGREVGDSLRKSKNWTTAGVDHVTNFWLKKITAVHAYLARCYNKILYCPDEIPDWMTAGITYLLPKNNETIDPRNYRPITCLPTMYKNLTGIISNRLYQYLEEVRSLPVEQKGCCRGSYGCKDQLLISKTVMEDCKKKRKDLSMAWIDYKKAFDSVPHSWIIKVLTMLGVDTRLVDFVGQIKGKWQTRIVLRLGQQEIKSRNIQIKKGLFQGDALSPLLFCLSLIPLTWWLRESQYGYKVTGKSKSIGHLLYMDDLKLFARSDEELHRMMKIVSEFSSDINMEFGMEKCAKVTIRRGKLIKREEIQDEEDIEIKDIEQGGVYKYLGVDESDGIQHSKMKERIRKEYIRRVRLVLRTELNAKNKINAIGALAVPVVQYSVGIVEWKLEEMRKMDRKTRKLLTMHGMHHPRADIHRLYLPRKEGGRGLQQLESIYTVTVAGLEIYLESKIEEEYMQIVKSHDEKKSDSKSILKRGRAIRRDLQVEPGLAGLNDIREAKRDLKKVMQRRIKDSWENKVMHGQYARSMSSEQLDKEMSFRWLTHGNLKGETESLMIAAQDQAIRTHYYSKNILKEKNDGKCRICKVQNETIDHIISGCSILAKREYIVRHNRVGAYVHWKICREYGVAVEKEWYMHQPAPVVHQGAVTILWDTQIFTDRKVVANKPDIVVKDREKDVCFIIDVAIPNDRNVVQKEAEKYLKYKDLLIECQRMWNLKTSIHPLIIGATGVISASMKNKIKLLPGNQNICELQKTAVLGTAHILRKVCT